MLPESILEKNGEDVNKPSFWKSLSVGDIWKSKPMRMIPKEFVRSTRKDIEHRLVFSVRWGNSWQCWLEREEDGLFMDEEDWNEFVDDNDLAPNDILCFTHENSFYLEARIFKNGKEVKDSPLTTNPEVEQLNTQPRYYHRDTTKTSSSVSGSEKTTDRTKGDYDVKNPKRYLSNPNSPYFVRKLVRRNDVLYVSQTLIQKFNLKFGPIDSPMTYIVPSGEDVEAYNKIYNGKRCFSGWAAVCRNNNWTEGDSLVCEFILSSQGVVTGVRVHLFNE